MQSNILFMPSRNRIKLYAPNSYYHAYNRGVEKRKIFLNQEDYSVFLSLLKRHLDGEGATDKFGRPYKDLSRSVEILAFCLMPNHFHLLIHQIEDGGMTDLLQRVMTAYVIYFNRKYRRVGNLFQDRFKAAIILDDSYLLHLSRYIHLNPLSLGEDINSYLLSSYPNYLGKRKATWVKPDRILSMQLAGSYEQFVDEYRRDKKILKKLPSALNYSETLQGRALQREVV